MGALPSGDACVMNPEIVKKFEIPQQAMLREISTQSVELSRRQATFRGVRRRASRGAR